jgi:hypothetical protein
MQFSLGKFFPLAILVSIFSLPACSPTPTPAPIPTATATVAIALAATTTPLPLATPTSTSTVTPTATPTLTRTSTPTATTTKTETPKPSPTPLDGQGVPDDFKANEKNYYSDHTPLGSLSVNGNISKIFNMTYQSITQTTESGGGYFVNLNVLYAATGPFGDNTTHTIKLFVKSLFCPERSETKWAIN